MSFRSCGLLAGTLFKKQRAVGDIIQFEHLGVEERNGPVVGVRGEAMGFTQMIIARRSGSEERGDQDGESVSRRDDDRRDDCRAQEFCLL
ncbi:hypothetical protein [Bradyrhizobium elkanii]|uniref:hypothetical protein n=1 Tax=Bradyrhizobium elkanii TaxID=29448 RepID=UPI003511CF14